MADNDELRKIIDTYDKIVKNINGKAFDSENGRAYGGIVRAAKAKLVEDIAKSLTRVAWRQLGQNPGHLEIIGRQIKIPIEKNYVDNIQDEQIKQHIKQNIKNYYYSYKPDLLVSIRDKTVLEIECKAYTENAMLKRILVDSTLLRTQFPDMTFLLLQLESQLGGDFSQLKSVTFGSPSTHTLLSYFDINLHIVTLLEEERKVDRPIHKPEFYKPLKRRSLEIALRTIRHLLHQGI